MLWIIALPHNYLSPVEIGVEDFVEYAVVEAYLFNGYTLKFERIPVKFLIERVDSQALYEGDFDIMVLYPVYGDEMRFLLDRQERRMMSRALRKFLSEEKHISGYVMDILEDVRVFPYSRFGRIAPSVLNGSDDVDLQLIYFQDGDSAYLVIHSGDIPADVDYQIQPYDYFMLYLSTDDVRKFIGVLGEDYIRSAVTSMPH